MNPLVTHATKDINVRNVHNDKFDVQKIAPLGLRPDLKTSVVPSDDVAAVKVILREYHAMKKETSMYICRLKDQLRQVFPQFLTVFSKVNGVTTMAVTHEYLTPEAMLAAGVDELSAFMKETVVTGPLSIRKKAELLVEAAQAAQHFGHGNSGIFYLIRHYIEMIRILDAQTKQLLGQVMMDDILKAGHLSEAHLRLLVDKIHVHEEDGKRSLDICLKAPFRDHLDIYKKGEQTECWVPHSYGFELLDDVIPNNLHKNE